MTGGAGMEPGREAEACPCVVVMSGPIQYLEPDPQCPVHGQVCDQCDERAVFFDLGQLCAGCVFEGDDFEGPS